MASSLIEEVFNRINTHKGIEGIIICDINGIPIKSTFTDDQVTYFYTTNACFFIKRCSSLVKSLLEKESLSFIRIRTKINEIMIAPDKEFVLLVVQSSNTGIINS